jgi:hypothetical protein
MKPHLFVTLSGLFVVAQVLIHYLSIGQKEIDSKTAGWR